MLLIIIVSGQVSKAASVDELSSNQRHADIIRDIQDIMLEHYVFLDKARDVNQHLDTILAQGFFKDYQDPEAFARALTKEMRRYTKDKHISVMPPRGNRERSPRPSKPSTPTFQDHLNGLMHFRDGGFGEVNFFEGNVGYFRLDGFRREDKLQIDPLMAYLETADAIIIDLRKNGGGGDIVNYLASYFLPEGTHFGSVYTRKTNHTKKFINVAVDGRKRLDVPLFILTSKRTFSAAEDFSYNLQARNRATIIGEATGGGAHPVNFNPIKYGFGFIVPFARSINPITKTNWEGVGVQPEVKISADLSLDKAKELAKIKATEYREKPFKQLEALLIKDNLSAKNENKVHRLLKQLLARHHLENFMVNYIGHKYKDAGYLSGALAIYKANIKIFPDVASGYESYAKALAENNQPKKALSSYKKAVSLAIVQKDVELATYQSNLAMFEAKL